MSLLEKFPHGTRVHHRGWPGSAGTVRHLDLSPTDIAESAAEAEVIWDHNWVQDELELVAPHLAPLAEIPVDVKTERGGDRA